MKFLQMVVQRLRLFVRLENQRMRPLLRRLLGRQRHEERVPHAGNPGFAADHGHGGRLQLAELRLVRPLFRVKPRRRPGRAGQISLRFQQIAQEMRIEPKQLLRQRKQGPSRKDQRRLRKRRRPSAQLPHTHPPSLLPQISSIV